MWTARVYVPTEINNPGRSLFVSQPVACSLLSGALGTLWLIRITLKECKPLRHKSVCISCHVSSPAITDKFVFEIHMKEIERRLPQLTREHKVCTKQRMLGEFKIERFFKVG